MCAQVMHFCQVSKITSFYITLFQEGPRFTFQAPPNLDSPLRAASILTHRTHLNPFLFLSKKQENVPKEWGPLGPGRGTRRESLGKLVNILSCSLTHPVHVYPTPVSCQAQLWRGTGRVFKDGQRVDLWEALGVGGDLHPRAGPRTHTGTLGLS